MVACAYYEECAIPDAATRNVKKPPCLAAAQCDLSRGPSTWSAITEGIVRREDANTPYHPPESSSILGWRLPSWPLARPPGLGLCDRRSGDTWRGVRLYSVNYPFLAAFATRRSTTPTAETASAACSRQNPHTIGCPWGRISSEVVASKGVGEDWLELSRKHLGIQDWDRIPKCLRFSSSQSSLAGSVLVRFFVGYCQLLL